MYIEENEEELEDNTITIALDNEVIEQVQSQSNLENDPPEIEYITIPSENYNNLIENIDIPEQEWVNEIKIDVSNINIPKLETLQNKEINSNSNPNITISSLMTDSTKDGISKDSTLVINVPQGITTNNFRTVTSNNTYQLSTLYQGQDNPVAFKPDSEIEIRVPQTTLDVTQISNYSITNNGNQNVPIPSGYDAVDSINLNVNVQPLIEIPITELIFKRNGSILTKSYTNSHINYDNNSTCCGILLYNPTGVDDKIGYRLFRYDSGTRGMIDVYCSLGVYWCGGSSQNDEYLEVEWNGISLFNWYNGESLFTDNGHCLGTLPKYKLYDNR